MREDARLERGFSSNSHRWLGTVVSFLEGARRLVDHHEREREGERELVGGGGVLANHDRREREGVRELHEEIEREG